METVEVTVRLQVLDDRVKIYMLRGARDILRAKDPGLYNDLVELAAKSKKD